MEATIYKICHSALWREAERAGAFAGAPVDHADGFIHFSTAAQVAETAARHFAGRGDLLLVAVDAAALGSALRYEPSRGGALVSASLWHAAALGRALGEAAAARGRRTACVPGACAVIALFDRLAAPLLRKLDPETAHALALRALKLAPLPRPAADDEKLRVAGVRPDVSQSGRARGRLRQECRSDRSAVPARLRLCRGRRRDAEAAAGQSASAAVPARRRTRR